MHNQGGDIQTSRLRRESTNKHSESALLFNPSEGELNKVQSSPLLCFLPGYSLNETGW